jgi:hypothetical protein
MENVDLKNETHTFGNVLLPAVILSLGFELKKHSNSTSIYVHTKHNVKLQKMTTGETSFFFQIPHKLDLEDGTVLEWTGLKRVETDKEVKDLFLVLWGTSL